jgi:hypothetical protein
MLTDFTRQEAWDNGSNNVWTLPLAPYLDDTAALSNAKPSTPAAVQVSPPPPHPSLPASIKAIFSGHWSGSGKLAEKGTLLESTLSFEPVADGEAILATQAEKDPNKYFTSALLSFDSKDGRPVMLLVSNYAGGARFFRSATWDSKDISFQSSPELGAPLTRERITFMIADSNHFRIKSEYSQDGGTTWGVGDEQAFTRS